MTEREPIVFHGDRDEAAALDRALARDCCCTFDEEGRRLTTCPPHLMLTTDQRALNGLLWMRRIRERLQQEEHQAKEDPQC
jgi:hypothetical protein